MDSERKFQRWGRPLERVREGEAKPGPEGKFPVRFRLVNADGKRAEDGPVFAGQEIVRQCRGCRGMANS